MNFFDIVVEAWLSILMMKESESTGNLCGLLRMSEGLINDGAGKTVQMNLRRLLIFGHFCQCGRCVLFSWG